LLSYKRDGNGVQTPVWAAPLDGKLVVFTLKDSFKVKRIGRNPKVRVAKCTVSGKVLGPWVDGICAIVSDKAHEARAYAALTEKYGMMMRIGTWFRTLTGGLDKRVVLEITLADA
jgi:PPOX class probable F420-dependent enzyme